MPGAEGGGGDGELAFNENRISTREDKNVPETDGGGDGFATTCASFLPLN